MWYLEHMFERQYILCVSHYDAISKFSHLKSDDDGLIPWKIMYRNLSTGDAHAC